MQLNVTNAERDDITLALRGWIMDLEEPLDKPQSALARRRRVKARQVADLCDRISMADIIPMPEIGEHRAQPVADMRGAMYCARCGKPTRSWRDGRFPIHASV